MNSSHYKSATWAVLLTVAVLFALLSQFTDYHVEDLSFQRYYLDYNGQSDDFSLPAFSRLTYDTFWTDNARWANIFTALITLMVPKWVFSVTTGVVVAAIFWLMTVIAGVSRKFRAAAMLALATAGYILLPWRGSMLLTTYLLNYVYPSLFSLLTIVILDRCERKAPGAWTVVAGCLCAFLTGWGHEALGMSLCVSLLVYAIINRFSLPRVWFIIAICLILGTVVTVFTPGILTRAGKGSAELGGFSAIFKTLNLIPAILILAAVMVVVLVPAKMRRRALGIMAGGDFVICFTGAVVGTIISLKFSDSARSSWFAETFAMITILMLLRIFPEKIKRLCNPVTTVMLYIAFTLFTLNLIRWQWRFFQQDKEIHAALAESPSGTVFYDIIDPMGCRYETLFIATRNMWVNNFNYDCLTRRFRKEVAVVPTALESYSGQPDRELPGSAKLKVYRGVLFSDSIFADIHDNVQIDFTTADGQVMEGVACLANPFTLPDGTRKLYIWPFSYLTPDRIVAADLRSDIIPRDL